MSGLVLSLFPGIGLLDMAFEQEGFCVVRGPDVLWGGDVRRFHPPAGRFDGVIGGPPCQAFSELAKLVRKNGHEPRFGNLIPEFERCVAEAAPDWFLMENVVAAPVPSVLEYGAKSFVLENSMLAGEDGFGQEQRRSRRITFGLLGEEPPNLMRWIDLAVFVLPDERRHEPITGGGDRPPSARGRKRPVTSNVGGIRVPPVTGSDGGGGGIGNPMRRYKLAEACRLQGLPEDFLSDAPFTAEGKLKAVANGVPLPMGRALAKAVKEAIGVVETVA